MKKLPILIFFIIVFYAVVLFDAYNVVYGLELSRTIATLILLPLLLLWYFKNVITFNYIYMLSFVLVFIAVINYIGIMPDGYFTAIAFYALGLLFYIISLRHFFANRKKIISLALIAMLLVAMLSVLLKLPFPNYGAWLVRTYVFFVLFFIAISLSSYLMYKNKASKFLVLSGMFLFITTTLSTVMLLFTTSKLIEFTSICSFWSYHLFMCLFMVEADKQNKETLFLESMD